MNRKDGSCRFLAPVVMWQQHEDTKWTGTLTTIYNIKDHWRGPHRTQNLISEEEDRKREVQQEERVRILPLLKTSTETTRHVTVGLTEVVGVSEQRHSQLPLGRGQRSSIREYIVHVGPPTIILQSFHTQVTWWANSIHWWRQWDAVESSRNSKCTLS